MPWFLGAFTLLIALLIVMGTPLLGGLLIAAGGVVSEKNVRCHSKNVGSSCWSNDVRLSSCLLVKTAHCRASKELGLPTFSPGISQKQTPHFSVGRRSKCGSKCGLLSRRLQAMRLMLSPEALAFSLRLWRQRLVGSVCHFFMCVNDCQWLVWFAWKGGGPGVEFMPP